MFGGSSPRVTAMLDDDGAGTHVIGVEAPFHLLDLGVRPFVLHHAQKTATDR